MINGSGNSKTQTTICVSTQILNIVLDVIISKCFGMGVIVCLVLSVIDIFFSGTLMAMYSLDVNGSGYAFAKLYLLFMVPNFFLRLVKYSIEALFKANLKMNLFAISSVLSLVCRIVFAFAGVSALGLTAMAWALLFGSAVSAVFDIYLEEKACTVKKVIAETGCGHEKTFFYIRKYE